MLSTLRHTFWDSAAGRCLAFILQHRNLIFTKAAYVLACGEKNSSWYFYINSPQDHCFFFLYHNYYWNLHLISPTALSVKKKKEEKKTLSKGKFSCSRTPASPESHQGHWLEPGVFRWVSQVAAITWSHDPQTGLNRRIVRNWWSKTQTENPKLNQLKHWENKEDTEAGETRAADTEKIMCMKILIH